MEAIGGFIEWEGWSEGKGTLFQAQEAASGRSAFTLILEELKPDLVFVPYYCCDSLLEPLRNLNIEYSFYELNEDWMPIVLPSYGENDYFLYIDYFGLCKNQCEELFDHFGDQMILDLTMAFFHKPDHGLYGFNSCRKFFGVQDGAYAFNLKRTLDLPPNESNSDRHLQLRSQGDLANAYPEFLKNEESIPWTSKGMSLQTQEVMSAIDYDQVSERRRENFLYLHQELGRHNQLSWNELEDQVPLYYPFKPAKHFDRKELIPEKIFLATIWPDVIQRGDSDYKYSIELSAEILPLPIDQRYEPKDLERMVKLIQEKLNV